MLGTEPHAEGGADSALGPWTCDRAISSSVPRPLTPKMCLKALDPLAKTSASGNELQTVPR